MEFLKRKADLNRTIGVALATLLLTIGVGQGIVAQDSRRIARSQSTPSRSGNLADETSVSDTKRKPSTAAGEPTFSTISTLRQSNRRPRRFRFPRASTKRWFFKVGATRCSKNTTTRSGWLRWLPARGQLFSHAVIPLTDINSHLAKCGHKIRVALYAGASDDSVLKNGDEDKMILAGSVGLSENLAAPPGPFEFDWAGPWR